MYLRGDRRLSQLREGVLTQAAAVRQQLDAAIDALRHPATGADARAADRDADVDAVQLRMEQLCLDIVALDEPHGSQARMLLALVRVNDELERIGDLAVHVAEQAAAMAAHGPLPAVPVDLFAMADRAAAMLDRATTAIADRDADEARTVRAMDRELDRMCHEGERDIADALAERRHDPAALLALMRVARVLERIGDHTVIIAEQVLFQVTGRVEHARHRPAAA